MSIGSGLAVCGIWIGVAAVAFGSPDMVASVALCAGVATFFIAICS